MGRDKKISGCWLCGAPQKPGSQYCRECDGTEESMKSTKNTLGLIGEHEKLRHIDRPTEDQKGRSHGWRKVPKKQRTLLF